ncbi:hypothetical protein L6452_13726 [Arctium lappa]|uniref:Uncharacterized protein n=1 Tax=Arctium lappa TaxID=4217 RepID=A0ACB9CJ50_ARCLA|nr:hypothetical protein L6452_13726 [Arctium lappa]
MAGITGQMWRQLWVVILAAPPFNPIASFDRASKLNPFEHHQPSKAIFLHLIKKIIYIIETVRCTTNR